MYELIAKYLSDNASEREREEVENWRTESVENAAEFFELKQAWIISHPVETSIELPAEVQEESKVIGWAPYFKYAAAVLLLAMIGSLWYFGQRDSVTEAHEVFAGISETLDDGTIVSLKNGAELVSVELSDSERVVTVKGKAFFEVSHDEDRPFYVLTENAKIKVLGTSFLVNTTADFTEVCVESGLVSFSGNSDGNQMSLNLEKGEMGMVGKNIKGIIKRNNDNQNFLAWKSGIMSFERTDVNEVISVLGDTYGADIELPQNLQNCQLTAKFNKKSLEEVIQILSATFNWEHDIAKDKVVLSGEGC